MVNRIVIASLACVLVSSASAANATPIISGNGELWSSTLAAICTQVGSGAPCGGPTVAIDRHPAWMDAALTDPLAEWVSYGDTGYGGALLAPQNGHASNPTGHTPILEIQESVTGLAGGALNVRFWADDTLDVYFNGVLMQAAVFGQDTCANAPIGCEPNEFWDLNASLTGGIDVIRIIAYQVGTGTDTRSNPFGLLYSGRYADAPHVENVVPEPVTFALLGMGLAAAGVRRSRRRT